MSTGKGKGKKSKGNGPKGAEPKAKGPAGQPEPAAAPDADGEAAPAVTTAEGADAAHAAPAAIPPRPTVAVPKEESASAPAGGQVQGSPTGAGPQSPPPPPPTPRAPTPQQAAPATGQSSASAGPSAPPSPPSADSDGTPASEQSGPPAAASVAPAESAATNAAPAESAPTVAAPSAPTVAAPAQPAPTVAAPAESAPTDAPLTAAARTDAAPAESTSTHAPSRSGRSRLWGAMRPRWRAGQLLAGVLLGVLGFGLAVQVRSIEATGLVGLPVTDLIGVLDRLSAARARFDAESRELQQARDRASAADGGAAARDEARKQAEALAILAGTAPARGPGIEFVIQDPAERVEADALFDAVHELRAAGANVISVGPVRLVASSSFVDTEQGITVDGTLLKPPYVFRVIGEPRSLQTALEIPGGVLQVLRGRYGATPTIETRRELRIDAVRPLPSPRFAQPVVP